MGCLVAFPTAAAATAVGRLPLTCGHKRTIKGGRLRAKFNGDKDNTLFQAAIDHAALHFQETHRPDPLFVDQYASCFVRDSIQIDLEHYTYHYCLARKFIDDELLTKLKNIDGLKQVVLFTDGMHTRPYRLSWPISTLIFGVSPETVFRASAQILEELPSWFTEIEIGLKTSFRVNLISYSEVAKNVSRKANPEDCKSILFVAEQLRFSDHQMETWRREFQRIEEDADEEEFEELQKYTNIASLCGQMETSRNKFQRIEEGADEEGIEEL